MSLKRWNEDELRFLKDNYATMPYSEISQKLERTEGAIRAKCFDLGLVKKDFWSEEEISFIRENVSNYTYKEMARILNRSENSVHLKANKMGVKKTPYHCDYNFFETIDTEEKAYWLGFIYADGWVSVNNETNSGCVGIELQKNDIEHLRKFNKSINGNYKITERSRACNLHGKSTICDECQIRIFSIKMADDLIRHGATPAKSFTIEFPEIDNSLVNHFIRGYFDGDGSIFYKTNQSGNKKTGCNFTSASKRFLESLREKLFLNGINSYINKDNRKDNTTSLTYKLTTAGYDYTEKFLHFIYDGATIFLDRKYKRFLNRPENIYHEGLASQK